jgi:hypothetical protein
VRIPATDLVDGQFRIPTPGFSVQDRNGNLRETELEAYLCFKTTPDRQVIRRPSSFQGSTRFSMARSACTKWTSHVCYFELGSVNQHHTQRKPNSAPLFCQVLTPIPTTPQDSLTNKQLDPIHVFES